MRELRTILALLRSTFLVAASYRVQLLFSLVGMLVSVVPLYFVSRALQQQMAGVITGEGSQYFAFVLVGTVAFMFVTESMGALPGIIAGSIGSGWFDSLLMAPTPLPVIMVGLLSYGLLLTLLRAMVLLVAGAFLGASVAWSSAPLALLLLFLIVTAYSSIGLLSAALIVAFRTSGPLASVVLLLSGLLGGVYYPTSVLPSWIKQAAGIIPLAPALRAMRRVLLEGAGFGAVAHDVVSLALFAAGLLVAGSLAMKLALRYARKTGTLSHY